MEKIGNKYVYKVGTEEEHITYVTPEIPPLEEIAGYDLPKEQQKWKRISFPDNYDRLSMEEQVQVLSKFLTWRINGYWVFINGIETYIAPDHFFYLNHWWMGAQTTDGYPEYRRADLLEFYFWDYVVKDDCAFGEIFLTGKRGGKTERSLARIYNKVSLSNNKHGTMQSLTEKEARENLFVRIIRSWQKIPEALRPLDEGIYPPKKALRFFAPAKKGLKKRINKKAIDSWIDYGPTREDVNQGKKPFIVLLDEPGTIKEMNLYEWFTTTKKQCQLGPKAIGKILLPTTLENLSSNGAQNFIKLWGESNFNVKDKNGVTQSGLYRYFQPGYIGHEGFVDEFGNDIMTPEGEYVAKIFLENQVEGATDENKLKLKRQYPPTIEDAFGTIASDFWEDDVREILNHVRTALQNEQPPMFNCTLYEMAGEILMAECSAKKEGVMRIYEKVQDGVQYFGGFDGAGSDQETGDEAGSKVAFVINKSFQGADKENFLPVLTFSIRPKKMEQAYHAVYLASKMFNKYGKFKLLGESNVGQGTAMVAYFGNRGATSMLMKKPKNPGMKYNETTDKYWIYRNEPVKEMQKFLANVFIRKYGHMFKHLNLVNDLIDMGKRNVDEADAFLMAVLAMGDFDKTLARNVQAKRPRMIRTFQRGPGGEVKEVWITEGQDSNNPIFKQ